MRNILVVDDSATMRRMIMASLRDLQDVQFHEAGTGLEAIERMALAQVHLMTLDLNMPDLHGLDVLKFVRGHETYRALPILVVTTRGDEGSHRAALAAGATLYLTKPFTPHELLAQVRALLAQE